MRRIERVNDHVVRPVAHAGVAAVGLSILQSFSILVISSTWQVLLIYIVLFVAILVFPNGIVLPNASRKVERASADEALAAVAAVPNPPSPEKRP